MKIGIIIGYLGIGGAERVAANLANWFTADGDTVVFFCTKKPAEKEYIIAKSIVRHFCYAGSKLSIISNLRKSLKKERPDIVLVMGTPMCVYAIPALASLGIPTVVSERSAPQNAKIKKATRKWSNFLINFAQAYVFQTTGAKSYFNKRIQDKGYIIPNPLVVKELPSPYKGERTSSFVAMGRLVREKNYPLLISSFVKFHEKHPEYSLEIYGDGNQREMLEGLINSANCEGYISLCHARNDVLEHVKDAAAFVLTSDLEGMPNALIEAMAIGLPCISTDCPSGGPADLIQNGINGILIPVNNEKALVDALSRIVEDKDNSDRMGKEAIKIRNDLDIDIIARKWKEVFQTVLSD